MEDTDKLKPEEKARIRIDDWLKEAGWIIADRKDYNPSDSAVAVRESILQGNLEADYLLFLEGKAIGVLEAKRVETSLTDKIAEQPENYASSLLEWYPRWFNPLPLIYLSNGKDLIFANLNSDKKEYLPIHRMHTPCEIVKMLGITSKYAGLPALSSKGLRECQYNAIKQLEKSFREGQNRALLVLATGAGKTFTACMASYRLLSYTKAKRILFLVDRNNLGKQAEGEFGTFRLTENGDPFNLIYTVNRLRSKEIPQDSNLVICTIQRLFSVLTGQELEDTDDDEVELEGQENEPEIQLTEDTKLPYDFFDYIIIDECHRSIYGKWRQVLNYFKTANIIGLTATPAPETVAFFNQNRVANYTLEDSIADGVNVDCKIYRIDTKVSSSGTKINKGDKFGETSNYTNENNEKRAKEEKIVKKSELNVSVFDLSQIKCILENYKKAIYTELYPDREENYEYIPKTLIFAQSDKHADQIVEIAREVFSPKSNNFVKKITYSTGNSNELIRQFRNDKDFRIAVTVTLVATGTDVKPLEVVMFMRDVQSESLYIQMKGRGCRTINDDKLRYVTPNAKSKDLFYLVDAVGVTEHEKSITGNSGGNNTSSIPLEILLEKISHGYIPNEYLRDLADKLSRINKKSSQEKLVEFEKMAGINIHSLTKNIFNVLMSGELPPFLDVNDDNIERKRLVSSLTEHLDAREFLLKLNAGFTTIIFKEDDELIYAGFSKDEAIKTTTAFEKYINEHKDSIKALEIIYNDQRNLITYDLLKDLAEQLEKQSNHLSVSSVWNAYSILEPKNVSKLTLKEEKEALTNLIQLVRYGFKTTTELKSLISSMSRNFELWCGQKQRGMNLTGLQREIALKIARYIVTNGAMQVDDFKSSIADMQLLSQAKREYGSINNVKEVLTSLSNFMLFK